MFQCVPAANFRSVFFGVVKMYRNMRVVFWPMGNKMGRRRQLVDEKYAKLQGLYQHKDVDHKNLILDSKLAPCYPGDDDCCCDIEECPICFLYYPSLNRSRCCMKVICTATVQNLKLCGVVSRCDVGQICVRDNVVIVIAPDNRLNQT